MILQSCWIGKLSNLEKFARPVLSSFVEPRNTLVAIWIGINDVNDSAALGGEEEWYGKLIKALFESVQRLYALGYPKVLFLNLPPLDRTSANLGREGGPSPSREDIELWDEILEKRAAEFGDRNKGSWVRTLNANGLLNEMLDEPGRFGIRSSLWWVEQ